jgi:Proteolysis_6 C-terminal
MMRKFQEQQRSFSESQGLVLDDYADCEEEIHSCCLCRETDGAGMGFCSFAFRNSLIARAAQTNAPDGVTLNSHQLTSSDFPTLSSCGHTMHESCLEKYRSSITSERQQSRELIRPNEFACPMCRALCNVLLPIPSDDDPVSLERFNEAIRLAPSSRTSQFEILRDSLAGVCSSHEFESRLGLVGFSTAASEVGPASSSGHSSSVGGVIHALWHLLITAARTELPREGQSEPLQDMFLQGLAVGASRAVVEGSTARVEAYFREVWPTVCFQAVVSAVIHSQRTNDGPDDVLLRSEALLGQLAGWQLGSDASGELAAVAGFVIPFLRQVAVLSFHEHPGDDSERLFEYWNVPRTYDEESEGSLHDGNVLSDQEAQGALVEVDAWCALFGWPPLSSVTKPPSPQLRDLVSSCLSASEMISPLASPMALRTSLLPARFEDALAGSLSATCSICGKQPRATAMCMLCGDIMCVGSEGRSEGRIPEVLEHMRRCGRVLSDGEVGSAAQPWLVFVAVDAALFAVRDTPFDISGAVAGTFIPSPYVDKYGEEDIGFKRGRPLMLDSSRMQAVEHLWASAGGEQVLLRQLGSNLYRL